MRVKETINIVSVVGPTASGKTKLAVALAQQLDGEIISADSMQIYQGMQIATAKPDAAEMQGIPHHLMDFLPPDQSYSVAMFVEDAQRCIREITARNRLPILVGGTGLYVDSLLNNIRFCGEGRDDVYTAALRRRCEAEGLEPLLAQLSEVDPTAFERLKTERNPKRIIRALEFYHTTGQTITEQNAHSRSEGSPYNAVKLGLNFTDRKKLYDRIDSRVDLMLENGLLEEARTVLQLPLGSTAVMAIGYKELAPYFRQEASLEECIEKLKRETRRYAKRQLTWFRRDREIQWLYVDAEPDFDALCDKAVRLIKERF